jgi:trimethylamine--corrinoid protein Co-methyltransferase
MDVGGRRAYFGTGSDLIFSHDAIKNERHPCVLEDVCRAARVADALPNFAVRPGWPMPCPISILSCRLHTHLTVRRTWHSWPAFKP